MRREKIDWFIYVTILVVIVSVVVYNNSIAYKNLPLKTVCIGDSITRAGGVANGGFCNIINYKYNTTNMGVNSAKVINVSQNINTYLNKNFTKAIIMIGTNDRFSDVVPYKTNLLYVVKTLEKNHINVTLLTIPPASNGGQDPINTAIREVANETGVGLIDTNKLAFNNVYTATYYSTDGLHLNDFGHIIMGIVILGNEVR